MSDQEIPIAARLFTWPAEQPRLLGSRCAECDAATFPVQGGCPRCASTDMRQVELSPTGTVWTWTSQEFVPPSPPYAGPETRETFEPYYVGYVELEGHLRVETRLVGFGAQAPRIGQEVDTVVVPFRTNEEGQTVVTYAFAPTAKESAHA